MADEGGDQPEVNSDGAVLKIEHGDGSVTLSLTGKPLVDAPDKPDAGWYDNLAEKIGDGELNRIADDLLRGIADDITSRQEWVDTRAQGLKLLGLKVELPGKNGSPDAAPVEGMSSVRHPLLLEAVLRFQANARSELLPTDGPVKIRNDDNHPDTDEDTLADNLELDLNHYLTDTAAEYYPDTDRMLLMLGFGGTTFKKVYFCPLRNRPVSESVDAADLIVNNAATDLKNATRKTHRVYMAPNVVKRLQILGVYRDISLAQAQAPNLDEAERAKRDQQGLSAESSRPEDRYREIYECYCELDIQGYEHKAKGAETGLEIPYRVTLDVSSREILSVVRNYAPDTQDLPVSRINFVKYTYIPGLGFYDIGLLHILGNTTNAATAAWRELLDAGMFASFPGFLYGKNGTRQNTNTFRIPPGGGAEVNTGGMDIRQFILPLPYKEPSPALMQLTENITQTGMRIGGTSEQQVGEGRADAPVGTTLAMIEQATRVENAVHKRLYAAQAEEFKLLAECFREHPEAFWQRPNRSGMQWDEATFLKALDDAELVPQADPNTASHTQRLMKVAALVQAAMQSPQLFNLQEVQKVALSTAGWSNPERFINANPQVPPEQIKAQAEAQADGKRADAAMIAAQSRAAEVQAKSAQGGYAPGGLAAGQPQQPPPPDPVAVAKLHLDSDRLAQDREEDRLEAENRERDRESDERIAIVDLVKELIQHPEGLSLVKGLIPPEMLAKLESNEPSVLDGLQEQGPVS